MCSLTCNDRNRQQFLRTIALFMELINSVGARKSVTIFSCGIVRSRGGKLSTSMNAVRKLTQQSLKVDNESSATMASHCCKSNSCNTKFNIFNSKSNIFSSKSRDFNAKYQQIYHEVVVMFSGPFIHARWPGIIEKKQSKQSINIKQSSCYYIYIYTRVSISIQ